MGQATLDLPDPLENPPTAPNNSADDLLSQLAGDEIDRMLADSDVSADDLSTENIPKTALPPMEIPAAPAAPVNDVNDEIDGLFNQLTSAEVAAPAAKPARPAPVAEPAPVPAMAPPAKAPKTLEEEMAMDQALSAKSLNSPTAPTIHGESNALADLPAEAELPVIFKPLAWLSAPLDTLPEGVREAMGKVAILTLINAMAVLGYVIFVRKH